ncbi:hypothetical protein DL93DRAFT_2087939 [Clavulina sp. PMI_390]|nr:hypothetical protein DL93DRAFT_2087939 [Clavulina sp. PMI_390]
MLDFDDRAAAFLSSASNLRVLGWKGGANATQTFDDFIYLPSLTILSLGTRPDTGDFDRITTSWFCTYINAPNLLHLDFVISQDIQEVLSWLIDEDHILAFPSVQSLRIFGTFSEVSLQTDVEGGAQSVEDLERAFVLFVASFPALKSLLIAVVNPDPKRRQELPKFTSLISHPPPGIVLFPQLRNIYIGYWCSFNNLWRSTSAASHDAIMNSLLPLRRGASFAIPTGGQVTGVPEDPVVRICPTAQHFNTVVIEGGALLRVLPEVKIELLTLGVVVEDPSWETGPWLMALGGWDVLQEFSERLQVRVLLESGWRANESR